MAEHEVHYCETQQARISPCIFGKVGKCICESCLLPRKITVKKHIVFRKKCQQK